MGWAKVMVRVVWALALCFSLSWASAAEAQRNHNGHYLNSLCRTAPAVCQGYVAAVVDVMARLAYLHGYRACFPPGIKDIRLTNAVARWLIAHPQMRDHPADVLVARSLAEVYPCR